jgi:hypothetical protein
MAGPWLRSVQLYTEVRGYQPHLESSHVKADRHWLRHAWSRQVPLEAGLIMMRINRTAETCHPVISLASCDLELQELRQGGSP